MVYMLFPCGSMVELNPQQCLVKLLIPEAKC